MLTRIATLQLSVSFGLSMFHTIFNLVNVSIMIWLTGLYVKIVKRLVPNAHKEDEEFNLKFIKGGLVGASELNLAQAEKEIVVYAQRVGRMVDMGQQLIHTEEGGEEFNRLLSRLEK